MDVRDVAIVEAFQKHRDEQLGGVYGDWDGRDAARFRAGYLAGHAAAEERIRVLSEALEQVVETYHTRHKTTTAEHLLQMYEVAQAALGR